MKFYNAGRRFFAMKADAQEHARQEGLHYKKDVHALEIKNREEICDFLNQLVGPATQDRLPEAPDAAEQFATRADAVAHITDVSSPDFDFIPTFMKRDWEKRNQMAQAIEREKK